MADKNNYNQDQKKQDFKIDLGGDQIDNTNELTGGNNTNELTGGNNVNETPDTTLDKNQNTEQNKVPDNNTNKETVDNTSAETTSNDTVNTTGNDNNTTETNNKNSNKIELFKNKFDFSKINQQQKYNIPAENINTQNTEYGAGSTLEQFSLPEPIQQNQSEEDIIAGRKKQQAELEEENNAYLDVHKKANEYFNEYNKKDHSFFEQGAETAGFIWNALLGRYEAAVNTDNGNNGFINFFNFADDKVNKNWTYFIDSQYANKQLKEDSDKLQIANLEIEDAYNKAIKETNLKDKMDKLKNTNKILNEVITGISSKDPKVVKAIQDKYNIHSEEDLKEFLQTGVKYFKQYKREYQDATKQISDTVTARAKEHGIDAKSLTDVAKKLQEYSENIKKTAESNKKILSKFQSEEQDEQSSSDMQNATYKEVKDIVDSVYSDYGGQGSVYNKIREYGKKNMGRSGTNKAFVEFYKQESKLKDVITDEYNRINTIKDFLNKNKDELIKDEPELYNLLQENLKVYPKKLKHFQKAVYHYYIDKALGKLQSNSSLSDYVLDYLRKETGENINNLEEYLGGLKSDSITSFVGPKYSIYGNGMDVINDLYGKLVDRHLANQSSNWFTKGYYNMMRSDTLHEVTDMITLITKNISNTFQNELGDANMADYQFPEDGYNFSYVWNKGIDDIVGFIGGPGAVKTTIKGLALLPTLQRVQNFSKILLSVPASERFAKYSNIMSNIITNGKTLNGLTRSQKIASFIARTTYDSLVEEAIINNMLAKNGYENNTLDPIFAYGFSAAFRGAEALYKVKPGNNFIPSPTAITENNDVFNLLKQLEKSGDIPEGAYETALDIVDAYRKKYGDEAAFERFKNTGITAYKNDIATINYQLEHNKKLTEEERQNLILEKAQKEQALEKIKNAKSFDEIGDALSVNIGGGYDSLTGEHVIGKQISNGENTKVVLNTGEKFNLKDFIKEVNNIKESVTNKISDIYNKQLEKLPKIKSKEAEKFYDKYINNLKGILKEHNALGLNMADYLLKHKNNFYASFLAKSKKGESIDEITGHIIDEISSKIKDKTLPKEYRVKPVKKISDSTPIPDEILSDSQKEKVNKNIERSLFNKKKFVDKLEKLNTLDEKEYKSFKENIYENKEIGSGKIFEGSFYKIDENGEVVLLAPIFSGEMLKTSMASKIVYIINSLPIEAAKRVLMGYYGFTMDEIEDLFEGLKNENILKPRNKIKIPSETAVYDVSEYLSKRVLGSSFDSMMSVLTMFYTRVLKDGININELELLFGEYIRSIGGISKIGEQSRAKIADYMYDTYGKKTDEIYKNIVSKLEKIGDILETEVLNKPIKVLQENRKSIQSMFKYMRSEEFLPPEYLLINVLSDFGIDVNKLGEDVIHFIHKIIEFTKDFHKETNDLTKSVKESLRSVPEESKFSKIPSLIRSVGSMIYFKYYLSPEIIKADKDGIMKFILSNPKFDTLPKERLIDGLSAVIDLYYGTLKKNLKTIGKEITDDEIGIIKTMFLNIAEGLSEEDLRKFVKDYTLNLSKLNEKLDFSNFNKISSETLGFYNPVNNTLLASIKSLDHDTTLFHELLHLAYHSLPDGGRSLFLNRKLLEGLGEASIDELLENAYYLSLGSEDIKKRLKSKAFIGNNGIISKKKFLNELIEEIIVDFYANSIKHGKTNYNLLFVKLGLINQLQDVAKSDILTYLNMSIPSASDKAIYKVGMNMYGEAVPNEGKISNFGFGTLLKISSEGTNGLDLLTLLGSRKEKTIIVYNSSTTSLKDSVMNKIRFVDAAELGVLEEAEEANYKSYKIKGFYTNGISVNDLDKFDKKELSDSEHIIYIGDPSSKFPSEFNKKTTYISPNDLKGLFVFNNDGKLYLSAYNKEGSKVLDEFARGIREVSGFNPLMAFDIDKENFKIPVFDKKTKNWTTANYPLHNIKYGISGLFTKFISGFGAKAKNLFDDYVKKQTSKSIFNKEYDYIINIFKGLKKELGADSLTETYNKLAMINKAESLFGYKEMYVGLKNSPLTKIYDTIVDNILYESLYMNLKYDDVNFKNMLNKIFQRINVLSPLTIEEIDKLADKYKNKLSLLYKSNNGKFNADDFSLIKNVIYNNYDELLELVKDVLPSKYEDVYNIVHPKTIEGVIASPSNKSLFYKLLQEKYGYTINSFNIASLLSLLEVIGRKADEYGYEKLFSLLDSLMIDGRIDGKDILKINTEKLANIIGFDGIVDLNKFIFYNNETLNRRLSQVDNSLDTIDEKYLFEYDEEGNYKAPGYSISKYDSPDTKYLKYQVLTLLDILDTYKDVITNEARLNFFPTFFKQINTDLIDIIRGVSTSHFVKEYLGKVLGTKIFNESTGFFKLSLDSFDKLKDDILYTVLYKLKEIAGKNSIGDVVYKNGKASKELVSELETLIFNMLMYKINSLGFSVGMKNKVFENPFYYKTLSKYNDKNIFNAFGVDIEKLNYDDPKLEEDALKNLESSDIIQKFYEGIDIIKKYVEKNALELNNYNTFKNILHQIVNSGHSLVKTKYGYYLFNLSNLSLYIIKQILDNLKGVSDKGTSLYNVLDQYINDFEEIYNKIKQGLPTEVLIPTLTATYDSLTKLIYYHNIDKEVSKSLNIYSNYLATIIQKYDESGLLSTEMFFKNNLEIPRKDLKEIRDNLPEEYKKDFEGEEGLEKLKNYVGIKNGDYYFKDYEYNYSEIPNDVSNSGDYVDALDVIEKPVQEQLKELREVKNKTDDLYTGKLNGDEYKGLKDYLDNGQPKSKIEGCDNIDHLPCKQ